MKMLLSSVSFPSLFPYVARSKDKKRVSGGLACKQLIFPTSKAERAAASILAEVLQSQGFVREWSWVNGSVSPVLLTPTRNAYSTCFFSKSLRSLKAFAEEQKSQGQKGKKKGNMWYKLALDIRKL